MRPIVLLCNFSMDRCWEPRYSDGLDGRGSICFASASYPMDIGVRCPGLKVHQSPSSSAEVNNAGAIPPLPDTSSWHDG
jgi:hypothetical protein